MNAGEGEAADAFTFKSDKAFIDWLLTAVTSEDAPRSLGDVVEQYATKLAQRDGLIAERDFVAGALDRLSPLATAARDAAAAAALHHETRRIVQRFAAALTARHTQETQRLTRMVTDASRPPRLNAKRTGRSDGSTGSSTRCAGSWPGCSGGPPNAKWNGCAANGTPPA